LALLRDADVFIDDYRSARSNAARIRRARCTAARPGIVCVDQLLQPRERGPGAWMGQLAQSAAWRRQGASEAATHPAACDYTTGYLAATASWRAGAAGGSELARRASLAQTAMWIERQGRRAIGIAPGVGELDDGVGDAVRANHLRPAIELSAHRALAPPGRPGATLGGPAED
jgi:hypothetical protein